eukprot:TRINITY_DN50921_c0_g1_i1.p1 TRINITY_DN50921_c0_g1~~TRINITY_DN50921_c0_g1_i1.p1  ORF type:complete len:580 (-),score=47.86 TRINITY_DN50921_c0_g1_i1:461-2200(-)
MCMDGMDDSEEQRMIVHACSPVLPPGQVPARARRRPKPIARFAADSSLGSPTAATPRSVWGTVSCHVSPPAVAQPIKRKPYVTRHNSKALLMRDYEVVRRIGGGAFGEVDLVYHRPTGEERVRKIVSTRGMTGAQFDQMVDEVRILRELDHPNVIKIYEYAEERDQVQLVIILEYVPGGSCASLLKRTGSRLSESLVAHCVDQLMEALAYCHSMGVVHRDLKPDHILLGASSKSADHVSPMSRSLPICKIIDFGLATSFAHPSHASEATLATGAGTPSAVARSRCLGLDARIARQDIVTFGAAAAEAAQRVGTPPYMAPEVVQKESLCSTKADMWSVGVLTLEMLIGRRPFARDKSADTYTKILEYSDFDSLLIDLGMTRGRFSLSTTAADFLRSLLQLDSNRRLSAVEALKHPWLAKPSCAWPSPSPSASPPPPIMLMEGGAVDKKADVRSITPRCTRSQRSNTVTVPNSCRNGRLSFRKHSHQAATNTGAWVEGHLVVGEGADGSSEEAAQSGRSSLQTEALPSLLKDQKSRRSCTSETPRNKVSEEARVSVCVSGSSAMRQLFLARLDASDRCSDA